MGCNPSQIWRGVMKSLNFLFEGLWWDERLVTYRWRFSSTGVYTVSSGYEVIKTYRDRCKFDRGEQSDKSMLGKFWKGIWSANIPNKVKIFCWRLYHNSLPDAANLRKRGVDVDTKCKLCGFQNETVLHVVKQCWWAKMLYSQLQLPLPWLDAEGETPADWLWWCSKSLKGIEFTKYLIAIWLCWRNRNNVWHDKEGWNVGRAVIIVKSMLKLLHRPPGLSSLVVVNQSDSWSPPLAGVVKINVDGAWDASSGGGGIGIVARNHMGLIMWCWAVPWEQGSCSSEVEGQALLLSMKLARRLGVKTITFETDSSDVFRVVSSGAGLADWCHTWLEEVIDLIRLSSGWQVQAISREANKVADWLACKARVQKWRWNRVDALPLLSDSLLV